MVNTGSLLVVRRFYYFSNGMKILELFSQDKLKIPGAWQETLDCTDRYCASMIYLSAGLQTGIFGNQDVVQSFYVIEGGVEVGVYGGKGKSSLIGKKDYKEGRGWSLLPEQAQQLKAATDCAIFVVSGKVSPGQLADKTGKNPINQDKINELSDYLVIKPWGSEQWLVENGVYVLKGITMNAGSECSLQVHEQKNEFNLVLRGCVKVSMGQDEQIERAIKSHRAAGKEQAVFSVDEGTIARIKQNMQSTTIKKFEGWKARPFQIHQVFSQETYFALEVSTPEVDDIVRLKDLYNRAGGRIASEHQQNK